MKKIMFSLLILMLVTIVNAQNDSSRFGLIGGGNLANITNAGNNKNLIGFNAGVFAEFKLSEKFAVQPEVMYSAQGAASDSSYDPVKLKLNYINIPVMAKLYVADEFNIMAGPQIGFLASAKLRETDIKDSVKKTDFGFNFGVGYDINDDVFVQARYNMGLTGFTKEEFDTPSKNSVFQLSLGFVL